MTNQKVKCFNILAIDDKPEVLETLKLMARDNGLKLTGVGSLEEAQSLIAQGEKFLGFIFDVVCNIRKDQAIESPDFISSALDFAKENFPAYPRVIITGHSAHYEGLAKYHSKEKIIEKGDAPAITEMFKWLRGEIENLRETRIKEKYSDVWKIFDLELLGSNIENELLETLMQMDNHNLPTIKDNLARIRRIFESIYGQISKRRQDVLDLEKDKDSLLGDHGELKITAIINHLKKNGHIDGVITEFSFKIWSVASDNGSHTPCQNPDYMPTKYTVQSITYALLDVLLWMKSILTKSK